MKLVATKTFTYAGRRIAVGDIFDATTDRDVKILVGIKNARHLEDNRPEKKIPAPSKELLERAAAKPAEKPETKVNDEPAKEPVKEEKPEDEEPAKENATPDEKPAKEPAETKPEEPAKEPATQPRRTYNRRR